MTAAEIQKMREDALRATKGEWKVERSWPDDSRSCEVESEAGFVAVMLPEDAAHACNFQPSQALALLDRLKELEERVDWLEGQREIECRQKENALKESRELLDEVERLRAQVPRLREALMNFAYDYPHKGRNLYKFAQRVLLETALKEAE